MKTKFFLSVLTTVLIVSAFGQKSTLELTFSAIDNTSYVQLDSIKVMNRTQGGDTVLYWPDTIFVVDYIVGENELYPMQKRFQVNQNYPNPVINQTTISLYVPEKDEVIINITDIFGRVLLKTDRVLEKGTHTFQFAPGSGNLFFFTAHWRGNRSSVKILKTSSNSNQLSSLEYIGSEISSPQIKSKENIQSFFFGLGDTLLFILYVEELQSGILDTPETNETYTFQFATNILCPGTPTILYQGQLYSTVQIFNQCWLKENLNIGIRIDGEYDPLDNDTIEKYCYNDDPVNCGIYGGLYQWNEMMHYITPQGAQGICPDGWHIPTDEEWKVLEGAVDSQYGIGDSEWDKYFAYRGFDAGMRLKTISGWNINNGTDMCGFSGKPGGRRGNAGDFYSMGAEGIWWSSTNTLMRSLDDSPKIFRKGWPGEAGHSVRCIRNY